MRFILKSWCKTVIEVFVPHIKLLCQMIDTPENCTSTLRSGTSKWRAVLHLWKNAKIPGLVTLVSPNVVTCRMIHYVFWGVGIFTHHWLTERWLVTYTSFPKCLNLLNQPRLIITFSGGFGYSHNMGWRY